MTMKSIHTIAIMLLAGAAGACTTPNPTYRGPGTDGSTDAAPRECPASCPAPTPVCDTETGQCVVCTAADTSACTGTSPVCHADNTCYGCMAHSECGSSACLVDGSCANKSDVAYVDPRGTDNPTCDQSAPCLTLSAALTTKRLYIKMSGETRGNIHIRDQKVSILADPQAKLASASDIGPVIMISGNSDVAIHDLEITGATRDGFGHGIQMITGNTAKVSLQHVTISKNAAQGIDMDGGRLEMVRSTVTDNQGIGIFVYGGIPGVTRSTIARNQRGGVSIYSLQSFSILNNFIVKNGFRSRGGGIAVTPRVNPNPGNDDLNAIKFNTIVDNHPGDPFALTGGIVCFGEGRTSSLSTNLIFGNTGGAGNPQTSGTGCVGPTVIDPATSPGFRLTTPDDYNLTSSTPQTIRDVVSCDGITDDIGGPNQRPQGSKCDLGADEYRP